MTGFDIIRGNYDRFEAVDSTVHCVKGSEATIYVAMFMYASLFIPAVASSSNFASMSDNDEPAATMVVESGSSSFGSIAITDSESSADELNLDLGRTSEGVQRLEQSLIEHKGSLMSEEDVRRYIEVMEPFAGLDFTKCLAIYSKVNRFVRTDLALADGVSVNVTFYVEKEARVVSFSVFHNGETLLTGAGRSDEIADRIDLFTRNFSDYVSSLS